MVTVLPLMAMISDGTATTTTIVVTKTITKRVDKKVTIDVIIRTFPRRLERGEPPKLAAAGCEAARRGPDDRAEEDRPLWLDSRSARRTRPHLCGSAAVLDSPPSV